MKRIGLIIILVLGILPSGVSVIKADTVTLRMGNQVYGTVVLQNEEIVVVQDHRGRRFQYHISDVESVSIDNPVEEASEEEPTPVGEKKKPDTKAPSTKTDSGTKKTAFLLELTGGGSFIPNERTGGIAGAELLIGSRQINGRPIFVGGGIGYMAHIYGKTVYNILPITVAVRLPLLTGQQTPVLGLSAGYGVALSKSYLGGMHASADVGYQYRLHTGTSIYAGVTAQFQHAEIEETFSITDNGVAYEYLDKIGRSLVCAGIKLAFQF